MEALLEKTLDTKIKQKKEEYRKEIQDFKETGHKFVNGEITSAEFKASSGGMGVYAQRSQKEFMVRLRIASGILDYPVLKLIQNFVHTYSLDFIHLTTRQAIQLHNLPFEPVTEIMEKSLDHNIITRGGGGNFPRNVSLSPLSGVEKKEAFDVTPYAVMVNKYFLSQINQYHLPRKFKVAFSNSNQDTANAAIADMGFLAVVYKGRQYFKLFLGGSLGVSGATSVPYDSLIAPGDVLYHVEALLRLFQEEGDYQNKGKARIRFIVKRMGQKAFLDCYKGHLAAVSAAQQLSFTVPDQTAAEETDSVQKPGRAFRGNKDVISQKQPGLYSVELHPKGGLLAAAHLDQITDFLAQLPDAQIRLTMEESMIIRNLTKEQTRTLLELTEEIRNYSNISRSVCCIGVPVCQIGIQNSQQLLTSILEYFEQNQIKDDLLPALHISGCMNSCSRHQVSQLGFQGKKKKVGSEVKDAYTIFTGGMTRNRGTCLGTAHGDITAENIPGFLARLAQELEKEGLSFDRYLKKNPDNFHKLAEPYFV